MAWLAEQEKVWFEGLGHGYVPTVAGKIIWSFFFFQHLFIFGTETEHGRGRGRERETQNRKQAPGSEPSAQSLTRGSNSRTARS